MDQRINEFAEQLLKTGFEQLTEREQRVLLHIAKRHPVSRNVNQALAEKSSLGERIADRVARFGGSWPFIIIFCAIMAVWALLNTVILTRWGTPFDPYPFIFLNLVLSMLAALQAPVIMMSQNRQAARDRMAAALDYEVNLKSEIEIMALHDKLDQLRTHDLMEMLREQQRVLQALLERREAQTRET